MLCALLSFVTFLLLVVAWRKYRNKYRILLEQTKDWPGPPAIPLIGHAHLFLTVPHHRMFEHIQELYDKYGKEQRLKIWFGTELNLFTGSVKDIAELSTSTNFNQKGDQYMIFKNWLKDGLLLSNGEKWTQRRKMLTPAFHFTILREFVSVFDRHAHLLMENLNSYANAAYSCELYKILSLYTLDVICETSMGVNIGAQMHTNLEYVQAVNTMKHIHHQRLSHMLYHFNWSYKYTGLARQEKKALAVLHGFTENVIQQRRAKRSTLEQNGTTASVDQVDAEIGIRQHYNLLDILLNSSSAAKPLSDLDIREEVDTFIFEGYETTATALQFFFYNMARNLDCQEKCYAEIIKTLGADPKAPLSFEQLNSLHYIGLCIKESLRMFPPVPAYGRKVLRESVLNGTIIPAGTNIITFPMYIGRLAEHYPEPAVFKPERFSLDAESTADPFAFIAFSAGARNCIGQKFAVLEMKALVAHVLRRFHITLAEGVANADTQLMFGITLCTKEPIMFHITERANII